MESVNSHDGNKNGIYHTDGQQIFPFQIQQLVNAQSGKGPPEPHDDKYDEHGFAHEPEKSGDIVHYLIKGCEISDREWHPTA